MPTKFDDFDEREALRMIQNGEPVGTQIPGLMNRLQDFVANPDSVSVYTYQRMIETDETRSIDWDRLRAFGLELADRGARRPVLVIQDSEAGRLVIDLGWVDPVRLYALIFALRKSGGL